MPAWWVVWWFFARRASSVGRTGRQGGRTLGWCLWSGRGKGPRQLTERARYYATQSSDEKGGGDKQRGNNPSQLESLVARRQTGIARARALRQEEARSFVRLIRMVSYGIMVGTIDFRSLSLSLKKKKVGKVSLFGLPVPSLAAFALYSNLFLTPCICPIESSIFS